MSAKARVAPTSSGTYGSFIGDKIGQDHLRRVQDQTFEIDIVVGLHDCSRMTSFSTYPAQILRWCPSC